MQNINVVIKIQFFSSPLEYRVVDVICIYIAFGKVYQRYIKLIMGVVLPISIRGVREFHFPTKETERKNRVRYFHIVLEDK